MNIQILNKKYIYFFDFLFIYKIKKNRLLILVLEDMLLFTYFEILIFLNILLLLFLFHKNILLIKIE